jgi:beta-lactam-binding protein with PASTA domain
MSVRWLVAVALLLGAALGAGCGTAVPDVKGKTPEQATETLAAAGFRAGRVDYDPAGSGARGAVIAQDPAAGQRVSAGAIVNLTVAGAVPVAVPALAGMTREGAASALTLVGLVAGSIEETYSGSAPAGTVVTQAPAAGTTATAGDAVGFVLSLGAKPKPASTDSGSSGTAPAPVKVKVPTVKGLKLAEAQAKIVAAGLKYKHVLGPGDGMTDVGFAYKQLPAAGTSVAKGTVVTVYSWTGP